MVGTLGRETIFSLRRASICRTKIARRWAGGADPSARRRSGSAHLEGPLRALVGRGRDEARPRPGGGRGGGPGSRICAASWLKEVAGRALAPPGLGGPRWASGGPSGASVGLRGLGGPQGPLRRPAIRRRPAGARPGRATRLGLACPGGRRGPRGRRPPPSANEGAPGTGDRCGPAAPNRHSPGLLSPESAPAPGPSSSAPGPRPEGLEDPGTQAATCSPLPELSRGSLLPL